MYENLSDIKYGDVLVAEYLDISAKSYQRNYIIFIANGIISDSEVNSRYKFVNIGVIAAINLGGHFVHSRRERATSIGFTAWSKDANETSIIRKPKFSEMAELIAVMKAHNFKFNRKTKKIQKI